MRLDSDLPFIAAGAIHLPERSHWSEHRAAAAHAAAHLVYSRGHIDAIGLGPIARHVLALLEDARVEALAARELPGLARLWRPLHTATPDTGAGFEALMARLSRALIDAAYDDPDPWVRKGRQLFFLDAELGICGLRTAVELRNAAMRLGHDIGQMRLQFNVKTHLPSPAYRDDHRWMWPADALSAVTPPPQAIAADALPGEPRREPEAESVVSRYPEWDRLISRLRPDWCRVLEQTAAPGQACAVDPQSEHLGRLLLPSLRSLPRSLARRSRGEQGEVFELDALIDWRVSMRRGQSGDPRVYRSRQAQWTRASVCLLIDQSASTGAAGAKASGAPSVLDAVLRSASAAVFALQAAGIDFAVAGFSSNGRHEVHLNTVKEFANPVDAAMLARLRALKPGGSTRLGAALRHAADRLARRKGGPRWVLLLSDGEPHDVDVHDPRYLVEDARHAVRHARRHSVRSACLVFAPQAGSDARRIFGRTAVQPLEQPQQMPRAIRSLLA